MEEQPEIKILVWFDIFDSIVDDDEKEQRVQALFDEVDLVYAQKNSYQSACERIYSNKVHKLPAYVNNDDAVSEYAKEREGQDGADRDGGDGPEGSGERAEARGGRTTARRGK